MGRRDVLMKQLRAKARRSKVRWIVMPDYASCSFAHAVPEGHIGFWKGHLVGKRGAAFVWLLAAPAMPPEAECVAAVEAALAAELAKPQPVMGTRINPTALGDTEDDVRRTLQVRELHRRHRAGEDRSG